MKHSFITAALALAISAIGSAQYSQPVRDVDKDARGAMVSTCGVTIGIGDPSAKTTVCSLVLEGAIVTNVPAGKILVIDDVSASCVLQSGQLMRQLVLGGTVYQKALPML